VKRYLGFVFFGSFFPLFVAIFYFEPQNKRIYTSIGAGEWANEGRKEELSSFKEQISFKKRL
ncbi:hypothetical protein, partial [Flavobacterium plurextorum]|uniref:hypothetical protein n=1 Tax=Flavobacterium plurextorum TaxID=1114867 RepID=UPI003757EA5A